ncbi:hypothetical protein RclHR1_00290034 [Rhizophagus clarus]|uniref:Uncharacterized protein n=1 Tax=Rhizophagus clarus TaxID=94130 RepID=A0A2Z6RY84_9GLOM|nr:hypothetical protein RclHR1_00290034 [Rhizophagus clarus]
MQLRNPRISKKKREYYSRIYNLKDNEKLVQLQIDKLQECDKYFGYCSDDFDTYFHFSLCTKCHNNLQASSHSTSPIIISPSTSPIHASFTEDSIKTKSFKIFTFTEFEDEILELVQDQFNPSSIFRSKKVPKSSCNVVPKESNIDEGWFCQEHSRTCFIDTTRHIQLTPHHLTSWTNAIIIYFSPKEGELDAERRRNSVKAVRGTKISHFINIKNIKIRVMFFIAP